MMRTFSHNTPAELVMAHGVLASLASTLFD